MKLRWQSKLVLLLVLPFAGAGLVLQTHWWATQMMPVALVTVGLSFLLGLVVLKLRAATPAGAATGAVLTASLMFATTTFPYQPWQTALIPVLAVSLLAWMATRLGREQKERLGTAEGKRPVRISSRCQSGRGRHCVQRIRAIVAGSGTLVRAHSALTDAPVCRWAGGAG
jgi:hypothetical protein